MYEIKKWLFVLVFKQKFGKWLWEDGKNKLKSIRPRRCRERNKTTGKVVWATILLIVENRRIVLWDILTVEFQSMEDMHANLSTYQTQQMTSFKNYLYQNQDNLFKKIISEFQGTFRNYVCKFRHENK